MRKSQKYNLLTFASLLLLSGMSNERAVANEIVNLEHNLDLNASLSTIEYLKLENKINRSLFLPELSLSGGLASEKSLEADLSYEVDHGPFLYLETKLNLYRGGHDLRLSRQKSLEISREKAHIEIKRRELQVSSYKTLSHLNLLDLEIKLIQAELEQNNSQRKMAQKKLDSGLTSSIDLIDFDLKKDILKNELDLIDFKKVSLLKELQMIKGTEVSNEELELILLDFKSWNEDSLVNTRTDSPRVIMAKRQVEISANIKETIKAQYLPSIDLEAKWGNITPQRGFNQDKREHQISIGFTFPLFTGFSTDYKMQQSLIESNQKKRELRRVEIEETSNREFEIKKIEYSKKLLISLNHSLSLSKKYKDLTLSEYKRGIKNSSDIISAADREFEIQRKILDIKNELALSQFALNETYKPYSGE